jgi:hypothetical protein
MFEYIRVKEIEEREERLITYDKIYKPILQKSEKKNPHPVVPKQKIDEELLPSPSINKDEENEESYKFERKNNLCTYLYFIY